MSVALHQFLAWTVFIIYNNWNRTRDLYKGPAPWRCYHCTLVPPSLPTFMTKWRSSPSLTAIDRWPLAGISGTLWLLHDCTGVRERLQLNLCVISGFSFSHKPGVTSEHENTAFITRFKKTKTKHSTSFKFVTSASSHVTLHFLSFDENGQSALTPQCCLFIYPNLQKLHIRLGEKADSWWHTLRGHHNHKK